MVVWAASPLLFADLPLTSPLFSILPHYTHPLCSGRLDSDLFGVFLISFSLSPILFIQTPLNFVVFVLRLHFALRNCVHFVVTKRRAGIPIKRHGQKRKTYRSFYLCEYHDLHMGMVGKSM